MIIRLGDREQEIQRPILLPGADFSEAPVIAEARRITGLDNFGDDSFLPNLRKLIESMEQESDLNNVSQALVSDWLKRRQNGAIVAIASSAGLVGYPYNADYCASKGGMIALTKAMALDLGPAGIRANAIAPGFIESDMLAENRSMAEGAKALEVIERFIPSRRFARMEDVAKAAVFLASDESAYTNGAVLSVDGGLTLGIIPSA